MLADYKENSKTKEYNCINYSPILWDDLATNVREYSEAATVKKDNEESET